MNKFSDADDLLKMEYDDDPVKKTATIVVVKPLIITREFEKRIRNMSEFDHVFLLCLPNEASPFTQDGLASQMDSYVASTKDAIGCHVCNGEDDLKNKISEISNDYEIETICSPTDTVEWLKSCIDQEVGDIGYLEDESNAIEYILKDDYSRFKSVCPTYINSMYMALQRDIEKTQKIDYQT
jgi:hypothetical protein